MKSRVHLFLVFVLATSGPALAGDGSNGLRSSGSVSDGPVDVSFDPMLNDNDRGRITVRRFGDCVLRTRRKAVLAYFDMRIDSELQRKALDRLVSDNCLRSGTLGFTDWFYRGTLFRSAYLREFTRFPVALSPEPVDFSAFVSETESDEARYYLATMAFAQCVVRKEPRMALRVLTAYPGSSNEKAAMAALKPSMAGCVPTGAQVSLRTSMIESVLSEALYREAKAAVLARSTAGAPQ